MATKFKCSDGIYTVLRNGKVVAIDATAGTALAAITGGGTFTVLRNGRVISMSELSADAAAALIADAANVVCPPECCMSDVSVALDTFDLEVTTGGDLTSLSVRATITHNEDTYSTAWATCTGLDTIDLVGIIVEVGGWFNGDTLCVEYSYDETNVIAGCCADIITGDYEDEDTYELTSIVPECDTSLFELLYQNPDGGVTVSPDGEMTIPDIPENETVFISRKCDGCLTELLVLTANADPPELGLRLTYTTGNLPANDLAAWNTFFDLPANGTAFTSMSTAGDEVTLMGGAGITLKQSLFRTSATLLKIEDDVDCVVAIAGAKNAGALSLCSALTTVTLNGVITVAQEGLFTNAALVNISLNACTTAGNSAFKSNTSVITYNLPALLTAAGSAFADCTSATTFTLPVFTTAGDDCFRNCTAATSFALPELLTAGLLAFNACSSAITFNLPKLTTAGDNCFENCTSATTFTLPLLTSAGSNGFHNCTAATTFTLPELLTAGDLCFFSCTSNVTFNIPKLTTASAQCFKNCTAATTFTLPLCTTIGDICFGGCTSVTTIDLSACTALGISTGDNDVFDAIFGNTITITVPTALSTCDSGNPDGDLVELDANNTATINYI